MEPDTEHTPEDHLRTAQLVVAERPIAIRSEHVAKSEILMRVAERANHIAPSDFIASLGDGTTIITAHGRDALFKKKREIRDGSGVFIFELSYTRLRQKCEACGILSIQDARESIHWKSIFTDCQAAKFHWLYILPTGVLTMARWSDLKLKATLVLLM
jgi:hypothetical protein